MNVSRKSRRVSAAVMGALLLAGITACGEYSADADQVGVSVDGYLSIPTERKVTGCVSSGQSGYAGAGDNTYLYPAGQRTYTFSGNSPEEVEAAGADRQAIKVVKDNIQLTLVGTVTFNLNADCETLKKFHTQIGVKDWGGHSAYIAQGTDDANYDGWNNMLNQYIGNPVQRAASDAILNSEAGYIDVYNGKDRAKFEKQIQDALPAAVTSLSGGDPKNPYFVNFKVQLQKPTLPSNVADALTAREVAVAQNEAQRLQNETIKTELESVKDIVAVLGPDGYIAYQKNALTKQQLDLLKQAIEQGKVSVLPVPTGTDLALPAK